MTNVSARPSAHDDALVGRAGAAVRHAAVALLFAGLSVCLTWPLAARLSTHVPGAGYGDNAVFLWNAWWMRQVLDGRGGTFLFTDAQFYPGGVDLALHTHTALNSLLAATVLGALPLATALNLTILLNGALNGCAAYLLAWRLTGVRAASIAAGVLYAASPRIADTLAGHFNHHTAWGLPLVAWAWLAAVETGSRLRAAVAGLALAMVAYSDYYYLVYAGVFIVCVLVFRGAGPRVYRHVPASRRAWSVGFDRALLAVALAAAVAALAISATGGFVLDLGAIRVSLRTGTNLRALAAAGLLAWTWRRFQPRLAWTLRPETVRGDLRAAAIAALVCAVLMAPVVAHGVALWRDGQYVTQAYFWRSAPAGADIGGLVLGNPFNGVWGESITALYRTLGMDPRSGPLWFSVAPLILAATWRSWRRAPAAGAWLFVLGVFAVWSMGPYLLVFGVNTGLPLPQMLLRYVPIVSNARIPSHAVIMVCLATSVLLALAIAAWRPAVRGWYAAAVCAVLLIDLSPAPIETHRLDYPEAYRRLAALPRGGVLELPFGYRDGFGQAGFMDVATLHYQTRHGHPLASGYVSRLPPRVRSALESPPFDLFVQLSDAATDATLDSASPRAVAERLRALGIRYVVLNEKTAPERLRAFVREMPLTLVLDDGQRRLLEVAGY